MLYGVQQPRDFIDRLLLARQAEAAKLNKRKPAHAPAVSAAEVFSDQKVALVCMDLFLAGTDTSSTTVEWLLALLATHPHEQVKLQVRCVHAATARGCNR